MDENSFILHVDANSQKLNVDQKNFGWAWSKLRLLNLVLGL